MTFAALLAAAAMALLLVASWTDLRSFTIPNWISAALLGLLGIAWALGAPVDPISSAVAAVIVGVVTFLMWQAGQFGGGDVKLLTVMAAWAGLGSLGTLIFTTAVAGGLLGTALIAMRRTSQTNPLRRLGFLEAQFVEKSGMPYGIAIAAGGILALQERFGVLWL